jgi:hypothetical protein
MILGANVTSKYESLLHAGAPADLRIPAPSAARPGAERRARAAPEVKLRAALHLLRVVGAVLTILLVLAGVGYALARAREISRQNGARAREISRQNGSSQNSGGALDDGRARHQKRWLRVAKEPGEISGAYSSPKEPGSP